ncbi:MAG: diacylglycerol O-acyltransferase [Candidatus Binatia bacterium]|nr:MAG: diacylglycerol O-acyltransferase [Candidatus Binatia bacterium]
MARYERLSVIDRTFLDIETPEHPQHVGVTMIFDAAPMRRPDGGIDVERIRRYLESRLHLVPRYRQKLAWTPLEKAPIWVDDPSFKLEYHVRHTALPRPGDEDALKRLAARIMSQRLDRGRPLWEVWVVEGLEGDRFALVTKTHHCMVDGIAGVDLMTVVLSPDPEEEIGEPVEWVPEPPPSTLELARDELLRRAGFPFQALSLAREFVEDPVRLAREAWRRLEALGETLGAALSPASETPLNHPIGPHRRFDWTTFDLEQVKAVKNRLGGTVNDVVLATVAGALGTFLERRGITRFQQRRMNIRAMVPVSVRPPTERGTTGNQIALWAATLPVAEVDPRRRLAAIREMTAHLKKSKQTLGAAVLAQVSEWTVPTLLSTATRLAYRSRAANLVVTNVPGPQIPLYLLGARMLATYPMLNLLMNQGLGVALFSYDHKLFWGFMADWDLVPDLRDFVRATERSFEELRRAAEVPSATVRRHRHAPAPPPTS